MLSYPFVMEPSLGVAAQLQLWKTAYFGFAAISAIVLWLAAQGIEAQERTDNRALSVRLPQFSWIALPFVSTSLLLAMTMHLTVTVASLSVLWTLPFGVYLLSFVVGFATDSRRLREIVSGLAPAAVVALFFVLCAKPPMGGLTGTIVLHLVGLFLVVLALHLELSSRRPVIHDTPAFYASIGLGGALAGVFQVLVWPRLAEALPLVEAVALQAVAEYPITLCLAAFCVLPRHHGFPRGGLGVLVPLVILIVSSTSLSAMGGLEFGWLDIEMGGQGFSALRMALFVGLAALCLSSTLFENGVIFGLSVLAMLLGVASASKYKDTHTSRSFFGVTRVAEDPSYRYLFHGNTLHGVQRIGSSRADSSTEPMGYYHRESPFGEVMRQFAVRPDAAVAIVGLGAGAAAAYCQSGQEYEFIEIDRAVLRVADSNLFSYLEGCRSRGGRLTLTVNDGRRALELTDLPRDLVVVDAFSSDAVPVHLLTKEAIQRMLDKTRASGALALHLSNRFFDLEPVVGRIVSELGLSILVKKDGVNDPPKRYAGTEWAVILHSAEDSEAAIANLVAQGWSPARVSSDRLWTDDYANLLSTLRRR